MEFTTAIIQPATCFFLRFPYTLRPETAERSVRNQATVYTEHDIPQGKDGMHDFQYFFDFSG